jgi:predicted carbohydrate-binding protein with CBM5 and CBM33 domain
MNPIVAIILLGIGIIRVYGQENNENNSSSLYLHGYVTSIPSRALLCRRGINVECGPVMYEPQSVEGPKGFPVNGPVDGKIASAGVASFSNLDEQSDTRWFKTNVTSDDIKIVWNFTTVHLTSSFEVFVTKVNWNSSIPLGRESFEEEPFCEYKPITPFLPKEKFYTVLCSLKGGDRSGYHILLSIWTIADTANAFYQVLDVNIVQLGSSVTVIG